MGQPAVALAARHRRHRLDRLLVVGDEGAGRRGVAAVGRCGGAQGSRGIAGPTGKVEDLSIEDWDRCIAIDLNVATNAMGTTGDMDPRLVALFEGYGFTWGGRWSGKNQDPMHFQYCSGY